MTIIKKGDTMERKLTFRYALLNAAYMMMLSTTSYQYNYLSQSGKSDGTIGILISLISIFGILMQSLGGDLADRYEKLNEKNSLFLVMALSALCNLLLTFTKDTSIMIFILSIPAFSLFSAGQPFINAMVYSYEKRGYAINYGIARGIGSLFFALGSSLLGQLWAMTGRRIVPVYMLLLSLSVLCLSFLMPGIETVHQQEDKNSISYGVLFHRYPKLFFVFLSSICLFLCHMMVNLYIAKIVSSIADNPSMTESIQGTALFIAAISELPAMFLFSHISKRFSNDKLLLFSSLFFSIKHILICFSHNQISLYLAMTFQMLSYAIIIPSTVYFVNENIRMEDQVKGQALFSATPMIGSLLASLIGGQLFQFMDISAVLIIATLISCIGTILMFIGIRKKQN